MNKIKLITSLYIIYISLMLGALFTLDIGEQNSSHFTLAWVVFTISCGVTYGYYALYRDVKLFGWKWIKSTFKQLFNN